MPNQHFKNTQQPQSPQASIEKRGPGDSELLAKFYRFGRIGKDESLLIGQIPLVHKFIFDARPFLLNGAVARLQQSQNEIHSRIVQSQLRRLRFFQHNVDPIVLPAIRIVLFCFCFVQAMSNGFARSWGQALLLARSHRSLCVIARSNKNPNAGHRSEVSQAVLGANHQQITSDVEPCRVHVENDNGEQSHHRTKTNSLSGHDSSGVSAIIIATVRPS